MQKRASHNRLSPRLFDMHSFASVERSLSAGTGLDASARWWITSASRPALLFFVHFSFIYRPVSSDSVIGHEKLPTSSMTTLINLIADVYNCACSAVFDSSLIIRNETICEPNVLICSKVMIRITASPCPPRPWLTFQPRATPELCRSRPVKRSILWDI